MAGREVGGKEKEGREEQKEEGWKEKRGKREERRDSGIQRGREGRRKRGRKGRKKRERESRRKKRRKEGVVCPLYVCIPASSKDRFPPKTTFVRYGSRKGWAESWDRS